MATKTLTLKKPDEPTQQDLKKVYMVLVEGRGEPKSFHFDIITGAQEAKRLAEKEAPRVVSLLQVVCRWQGKTVVDDAPMPQPAEANNMQPDHKTQAAHGAKMSAGDKVSAWLDRHIVDMEGHWSDDALADEVDKVIATETADLRSIFRRCVNIIGFHNGSDTEKVEAIRKTMLQAKHLAQGGSNG